MAQVRSITWLSLVGVLAAALPELVLAQPAPPPLPDAPYAPPPPAAPAAPPPAAPPPGASASVNMSFVPSGSASVTYQSGQPPQQAYDDGSYDDDGYDDQQPEAAPVVREPPPAMMQEAVPVAPYPGYVWAPGYWYWYGSSYSWVAGRWIPPHPGYYYVGPRWAYRGGFYTFLPGGWSISVGGPVAYPLFMHRWHPGYYPRHYVSGYYGPRPYYTPPRAYVRPRVYVAPRAYTAPRYYSAPRGHYYNAPARSFRPGPSPGPAPRHYSAPPMRGNFGGGGHHYSAPPSRGRSSGGGGHHHH